MVATASEFTTITNDIYAEVSSRNNVDGPRIDALLVKYGVSPTSPDVTGLTMTQRGNLMAELARLEAEFGTLIADNKVAKFLADNEYANAAAAATDVDLIFKAATGAVIKKNVTTYQTLRTTLDAVCDAADLAARITRVVALKDALGVAAPNVANV